MATTTRKTTAPVEGVNFGDLGMYVAGGGLPDGDYCLFFVCQMYQAQSAQGQSKGPARLGIMVNAYPLDNPTEENAKHQFYSMGSQADKSFAPNPNTGKGVVPIPGAPGATLNNSTNWAIFLKSLYDSGLPQGIFTNDLTTIDGVHVRTMSIPEPEERKGFQSQTGEAAGEPRREGKIAIITEIKEDGKPWEGTGGIPTSPKPKVNGAPTPKTAPAKALPPATAPLTRGPAPTLTLAADTEDLQIAAQNGVSSVLEKRVNGCPRLMLRTETFAAVSKAVSEDMASAVIDTYFRSDDSNASLNGLLGLLGYVCEGPTVKVAA